MSAMAVSMKRLQRADRLLGGPAFFLLRPLRRLLRRRPSPAEQARPPRILLIKFWGLGSLQLLTPAVRVLRRRHPGASLELLTLASNRAQATGLGVFDRVHTLDVATGWFGLAFRILRTLRRLRRQRFDVAYDFEFFTRFSAVVSVLSGAPRSHGFVATGIHRDRLHTDGAHFQRTWHVARNFRSLAGGEDGTEVAQREIQPYRITLRDRAEAAARLFSSDLFADGSGSSGNRPLVVLNPNAGSLSLERCWPAERFGQVALRLIEEDGARVVLIGSAAERSRTRQVAAWAGGEAPGRLLDLAGELSLGALAALLESAAVFLTNDSGPMHLAAALGTPTVALFGPETPTLYRPLGPRVRVLYRPPACSPCINVHENKLAACIHGRALCLTEIGVGEVLGHIRSELSQSDWRCASSS